MFTEDKDDLDKLIKLVKSYLTEKEFQKAEDVLLKANLDFPEKPEIKYLTGITFINLNKIMEATINFLEAVRLTTKFDDNYFIEIDKLPFPGDKKIQILSEIMFNSCKYSSEQVGKVFSNIGTYFGKRLEDIENTLVPGTPVNKFREFIISKTCLLKALMYLPNNTYLLSKISELENKSGNKEKALNYLQKLLTIEPDNEITFYNIANILIDLKRYSEAENYFFSLLELNPDNYIYYRDLALLYYKIKNFENAEKYYQIALEKNPDSAETHMNFSLLLLSNGKYELGWKEFEWRHKVRELKFSPYNLPLWTGQDVEKNIIIEREGGFGDVIQMLRYIPFLSNFKSQFTIHLQPELEELVKNNFQLPNVDFIFYPPEKNSVEEKFDMYTFIMSFPFIFKSFNSENIPFSDKYLKPSEDYIKKWKNNLRDIKNKKIGITWKTGFPNLTYAERSCEIEHFMNICKSNEISIISLQKERFIDDLKKLPIYDFSDKIDNFSDTAALINEMDLIISIDTSVAHLAGSMGKMVWNLLNYFSDWRWGEVGNTTPWYYSMKLFRQNSPGDWESVFNEVEKELKNHFM